MVEWFVLAFPTWIDWWEWTLKFDQIMTCSLLSSPGLDSKGSNILLKVSRLLINEYLNGKSTISSSFSEFIMNLLYAKDSNNCDDGCGSCFNPKGRWIPYFLYRLEGTHYCGLLDSDNMVEEVVEMTNDHMKIVKEAQVVDDIWCYQDRQDDFFLCSVQRER